MSLYKYFDLESLKRVIGGSIRFTQPGAFNDPFEMLPEVHWPSRSPKTINISFDLAAQRRSPPVGELPEGFESDDCNDVTSRDLLSILNYKIGVLCLSKNPDSLLMWSHYADSYAGAVIEFDDEHEFFEGKIDIAYYARRPIVDISRYLDSDVAVPISELCVKSEQWKYESEVRLIRCLSDCKKVAETERFSIYVMDLPINCIKSIILGERTSLADQREIWESVKETEIALSLAAIANWGYEFRRELIKTKEPYSRADPWMSPRTAHIFKDYPGKLGVMARWMIEKHKLSKVANQTV